MTSVVGSRDRVGDRLEVLARVVLIGSVAVAPWLATPIAPSTERRLGVTLTIGVGLWVASLVALRRRPAVPAWLSIAVAGIVAYSALMLVTGLWAQRGPTADVLVVLIPVLAAGVAIVDLARIPIVRELLLWSLAASGALLSLAGVLELVGLGGTWTDPDPAVTGTPFATFGYHGNAATFLALALIAALLLDVLCRQAARPRLARVALVSAVVIGCGIAANVSKAGLVLAVVIVCFWTWALRSSGVSSRVRPKVVLGCAVVAAIGVLGAWSRWAEVSGAMSTDGGRWLSWRVALHAWGRSPVTGSGPGTYKVLMPDIVADEVPELYRRWIVQDHVPGGRVSIWMHAHHDGLQALAEWGAIGTALLAVVVIGTLATAVSGARRATSPERVVFLAGAIALGTVLVHGSFDFPFHVASLQLAVVAWTAVVLSTAMREAWPRSVSRMNQL